MNKEINKGDTILVIANVDHAGDTGEVISINERGKHPIKVKFGEDWTCYSSDEIEVIKKEVKP